MAVVEADEVDAAGGGEVGDGRGGRTGDDERGVDLAVLQALGAVAEALVHSGDVRLLEVVGVEHVNGVEVHAGAGCADGDLLAGEVGNGLDVGVGGDDLNLLLIQLGDDGEAGDRAVKQALAVVSVVHDVALHEGELDVAIGQILDVGLRAAGGEGRDLAVGLAGDEGSEHAAESVVRAGLAAGAEAEGGSGAVAGAFLDRVDLEALLLKVLGSAGVIRHALDGGGSLKAQLRALGVLGGDGVEIVKDGGHERIDLVGRDIVAGDDDRADGDGVGIDLGSGTRVVGLGVGIAAAAGAQREHHDEGERQSHDFVELHSWFSPF